MGICDEPMRPCAWNVMVMQTQLTLVFHVDDLLISHVKPQAVTNCVKTLDVAHGRNEPLKVTRGKLHEHL